jgi:hypothetical protein
MLFEKSLTFARAELTRLKNDAEAGLLTPERFGRRIVRLSAALDGMEAAAVETGLGVEPGLELTDAALEVIAASTACRQPMRRIRHLGVIDGDRT